MLLRELLSQLLSLPDADLDQEVGIEGADGWFAINSVRSSNAMILIEGEVPLIEKENVE